MIKRIIAAAFGVLLMTGSAQAQQKMSPADVAKTKADVEAALQHYMTAFSAVDLNEVRDNVWNHPSVNFGANGATLIDPAQQTTQSAGLIKQLQKDGWVKSDQIRNVVCVLTPTAAIVSGDFRRMRADGSVISSSGTTNLFAKNDKGWKMVARIVTEAGKVTTCND